MKKKLLIATILFLVTFSISFGTYANETKCNYCEEIGEVEISALVKHATKIEAEHYFERHMHSKVLLSNEALISALTPEFTPVALKIIIVPLLYR